RAPCRPARRAAAGALAACLLLTLLPVSALAAEGEYPCGHVHDDGCGYVEAVEGAPCAHLNGDGTYSCAPEDAGEGCVCAHDDGCGYVEAVEGAPCAHTCDICDPPEAPACLCDPQAADSGEHTDPACPLYVEPDEVEFDARAAGTPSLFAAADENTDGYADGDVAAINAMITNNSLSATQDDPAGWKTSGIVTWNEESPKRITQLSLSSKQLTGALDVSALTALTSLGCRSNGLTALEGLDKLTELTYLNCGLNQLSGTLDVSALTKLTQLDCEANQLTALDGLGNLTALTSLSCRVNQLTALDGLGSLTALTSLYCDNNKLTALGGLGNLTALKSLNCYYNQLTALDGLDKLTKLTSLNCGLNKLSGTLDVSALTALTSLSCGSNQLTALDGLGGLTALKSLDCRSNQLTALEGLGNLTALTSLDCSFNNLSETLDVSALTALTQLNCRSNERLTALNGLGSLTNLSTLLCSTNELTALDGLGNLTKLMTLECYNNQLTGSLDVTGLQLLTTLKCSTNQLTALDGLSGLARLTTLECSNNQLMALDVTGLRNLRSLTCAYNPLALFKLSDAAQLTVGSAEGGTVTLSAYTHGSKSVTLSAAAAQGYAFQTWEAEGVTLTNAASPTAAFSLDGEIALTPVFQNEQAAAVAAAKAAIEGGAYTVAQAAANTESAVKTWLAGVINALDAVKNNGITVAADDISVTSFTAAIAGSSGNEDGTNGSFSFTVVLSKGAATAATASKSGVITATSYQKSSDATLSALTYRVGSDGQETAVPGFASGTASYSVELPFGTSATASITLTGVLNDSKAIITENNGVPLVNGSGTATLTVTAEDGTTTKAYTVSFVTTPAAPAATAAVIDYKNETISFANTLQMNTAADFTGTEITSGSSLTDYISAYGATPQTLYIRVKAAGNVPASAATAVTIPARPLGAEGAHTQAVTDTTLTVTVPGDDVIEHTIDDWSTTHIGAHTYENLNPGTDYTLSCRRAATQTSFKSAAYSNTIRTQITLHPPTVADSAKGSAEVSQTYMMAGYTATYTVTFAEGWTPTLTLTDSHGTLSGPVKGDSNTWTYAYTASTDDKSISAAVSFAERKIASVSYVGEAVTLFADSAHNATADALKAYLGENVQVTPVYDNGTTGEAVTAGYALKSGSIWDARGGTYTYAATADGKTCDVPVAVKPVNAAIGPVSGVTKVRTGAGYADHTALGLPETVAVTYTGDGYVERTDVLAVSWSAIPAGFGKAPGSHDFTGAVTLPTWASYTANTTSATVTISDKTALTDGQMSLVMDGWTYGETVNTPTGSVTVTDGNGSFSYQYSADSGATWANALPLSSAGAVKAGAYLVKMNYEGDTYIGAKMVGFTVAQKPVTLGAGTLAASKPYDGTPAATLTGAPAITGVLDGDTVTATGGSGVYASTDAGESIAVTVTGFTLTGDDAGNYSTTGTVSGLTGTITPAPGTAGPHYAAALDALKAVHIVTNVTPALKDVTLPGGWAFTGDKNARLAAKDENEGKQLFPVQYTPADANYAPGTLTDFAFPVSTVALEVNGGLDMKTIESVNGTLTLSPVALEVTGAALPDTGPYAISNMEWSSSVTRIATVTGSVAASNMSATITAHNKGVTMVGVAYQNDGGMLGYVLVQVVGDRTDSANTVEDITTITETLDKLIDPKKPSATDKAAVDAVADEVTKLPDAAKQALTVDDVKALDELKQAVGENVSAGQLNITIDKNAEGQAPAPENVSVVGAAIACGVDSGNVVVTVKPVQPTGSDTKLELKMEMTVGGTETQLAAPMFFQMDVPEDIDLENLKLYHVKDDGSKTELSYEKGTGRTISFKMMSFSSVQFVVSTGGASGGTTGGGGGTTTHTLTATAGEGGKIAPSGKVCVTRNSNKTFTITPADGYEIADVLVDGKSVGAVGTYTFEKVKTNHTIAASFRAEDERPAWNPFIDVKEGAWYYDSVKYVYERGLMNGSGKTTFSPGLSTTRGMIVTILWRLEQSPESGAAMAFTDVKAGSYCYEAVRWAAEHEIVKGYTAITFGPDNTTTRQELAAILYRYAQYKSADVSAVGDLTAFTDHPDPWAEDAVKWAVGTGILTGKGDGILDPKGQATRAQVAVMLERFTLATAH
ncbi:leucine-rich repeat domain-containing protein, partial [uncultured Oscillibacter sp.]|uniref:leucine-rich repeat domain-containing protein n=1 Tax=uncultured Oscillibacter sp. TaxID=876091 RepID=UPI00280577DA